MRLLNLAVLATLAACPALAQPEAGASSLPSDGALAEARAFDRLLGRDGPRDLAEAIALLEQAVAAGRPNAAHALAQLYDRGQGVAQSHARALELYAQAAAAGIAGAQMALGYEAIFAPQDPAARDPGAALAWLGAAAEQADPIALYLLGQMYLQGEGVERDWDLFERLTLRAAELGYAPAGVQAAGVLLAADDATADDIERGLYFLRAAANAGMPPGAYALARLHLEGRHVERDDAVAAEWLTRASEREYAPAMVWLAELYAKGIGVEADAGRATELRERGLAALSIDQRNTVAWELAVSTDDRLRNGPFAAEVMEAVTAERPSAAYLDTLAAAYAEAGRFDDALRAQQRALDALTSANSAAMRDALMARLELYRSRRPYRERL